MSPDQDPVQAGMTYRDAGVDIDKAADSLAVISRLAKSTIPGGSFASAIGHFGGVFPLPAGPDRLLVASADGVGTKIKLAFVVGGWAHTRVGGDLVNHCVNDVLACGASPLFFLDYVAMGEFDSGALEGVVEGMAMACRDNGLALIGGETAEMPGLYAAGEYDVAGFIVGEVAPEKYIDGRAIAAGDVLIGYPSVGLHTNGYSLARTIIGLTGDREHDRAILDTELRPGSITSLGDALLAPHPSYRSQVLPLLEHGLVRGMAHITGGGLLDNVPRMIPDGLVADIDPSGWDVPEVFTVLVERGNVPLVDRYRAFNMGIGFVAAVAASDVDQALDLSNEAYLIGSVREADSSRTAGIRLAGIID